MKNVESRQLKNWLNTVVVLTSFQTIISCGGKIKLDIDSEGFTNPFYSQEIVSLKKQDDDCSKLSADLSSWEFSVYQLTLAGEVERVDINVKGQINKNLLMGLNKAPIKNTFYNKKTNQVYQYSYDPYKEDYIFEGYKNEKILEKSIDLQVCAQKSNVYERDTYEGIALSVSDSVNQTYNAIKEIAPSVDFEISIPAIDVMIAPLKRIQKRFLGGNLNTQQYYVYETDNATYNPLNYSLTILPQSKASRAAEATPFWEVPLVGSHEYGHHIFHILFNKYRMHEILGGEEQEIQQEQHKHSCFMNKAQYSYTQKLDGTDKHDNSSAFAIRSINEGFADLMAYYTLIDEKLSLKKLECFEKTRSVKSFVTASDEEKVFSASGLEDMNKEKIEVSLESTCDSVDFQRIHSLGSVMAHQFDKILTIGMYDKKSKLKLSLEWLNALKENHNKLKEFLAADYMYHAFELLFKVIQKDKEKDSTGISQKSMALELRDDCEVMDKIFLRDSNPKCIFLVNKEKNI